MKSFTILSPTSAVLIPCYNAGRHLGQSIESILAQSVQPKRVLIIDDGSTDDSRSIAEAFAKKHESIKLQINPRNMGKAASLNAAIDSASETYLLIQDADDISHPTRIEHQIQFMEADASIGASSSFIRYVSDLGKPIGIGKLDLTSKERLDDYLSSQEPFGLFCPAVILRTSILSDYSLRFRSEFWPADDIDLWNRIAEAGWQVRAQPEYLVDYRIHGNSAVTSSFHKTREKFEFVRTCLRARRSANPEPTWDEFVAIRASRPMTSKLNDSRKALAKGLYRNAGFRWGEGRRLTGLLSLTASACLQPGYVLPRLRNQLG